MHLDHPVVEVVLVAVVLDMGLLVPQILELEALGCVAVDHETENTSCR